MSELSDNVALAFAECNRLRAELEDASSRLAEAIQKRAGTPTDTFRLQFKDPDFLYQSRTIQATDEARERLAEFGEYFTIELEMDADMVIHSARFLPVKP